MNDKRRERPEAYPKPTESDNQLGNQPEFIDEQPNDFRDKSISNLPSDTGNQVEHTNDPKKEMKEE